MKNTQKTLSVALIVIAAYITITQVQRASAAASMLVTGPATSSITPTNVTPTQPVTSAVTPTATPTVTATNTPTPTVAQNNQSNQNNNNNNNNSNNNSNNNNSNNNSHICSAQKPAAPVITGIYTSGTNQVTLTWNRVRENVTGYVIAYGRKPGVIEYASGQITSEASSFTIKGIPARSLFYFRVRAGNGCMPGEFSNEVNTKAYGQVFQAPAQGFSKAVLGTGSKTKVKFSNPKSQSVKQSKPKTSAPQSNGGLGAAVTGFMKKLFGN